MDVFSNLKNGTIFFMDVFYNLKIVLFFYGCFFKIPNSTIFVMDVFKLLVNSDAHSTVKSITVPHLGYPCYRSQITVSGGHNNGHI
jgi:hypothetical protein